VYYASLSSYNNTSQAKLGEFIVVLFPRNFIRKKQALRKQNLFEQGSVAAVKIGNKKEAVKNWFRYAAVFDFIAPTV
jgi:hypothetical protein